MLGDSPWVMNGPVSKSTGWLGPGIWLSAVRTCKCAAFSLKRSTAATGAWSGLSGCAVSLRNAGYRTAKTITAGSPDPPKNADTVPDVAAAYCLPPRA